ncbi:MAG TPA: lysoplasmalogenase [Candidatus Acidoferrum sp.]|nr:lysoplasmalogenase [Candidatus Acidoferrum sp.]
MPLHFTRALKLATGVGIVAAITVHFLASAPLLWIFAPLATILILAIAFANWRARNDRYSLWITIGLLFSLVGDVLLLRPDHFFTLGLSAFLLTHIAYLFAFTRDTHFPARFGVWILYLLFAACCNFLLFSRLPAGLRLPIAVYSVFLVSMAAQAMGRSFLLHTSAARYAAVGALLFVFSDSLLAFNRFYAPLRLAPLLILVPYYAGQWLIASSTDDPQPS